MIRCTVGITAYNEAENIGRLLERLQAQQLKQVEIAEIIVVASGCTDATEQIVRQAVAQDQRIRLLVQPQREGKASAINLLLNEAEEAIIVLCSADLMPELDALEQLVTPLAEPSVGMTGCRPIPINDRNQFMGFAVHLQWELHHQISLQRCKAGEMVAFRKLFERIPPKTSVDEASIEPLIRGQGYEVRYVPSAVVWNKGPETVSDFLRQRRRIYAGHLEMIDTVGYAVSTMRATTILKLLWKQIEFRPKPLLWTIAVIALEGYGRWQGKRDYQQHHDHSVWEIAKTTKQLDPDHLGHL